MDIEKLCIELIKASAKELAPFPVNTILVLLIEDVANQEKTLSRFEQRLEQHAQLMEKHLASSFKEGKVYLEEAQSTDDQNEQNRLIRTARERFISASQLNIPQYPALPVMARFYVGVCYDLLSDSRNALRWYKKAHDLVVKTITTQDPRTWREDKRQKVFSKEARKKFAEMDAKNATFDYMVMFAIPVNADTARKSLKFRQEFRQQKITELGTLKDWPMGELATKRMLSFAGYLTELIAFKTSPT